LISKNRNKLIAGAERPTARMGFDRQLLHPRARTTPATLRTGPAYTMLLISIAAKMTAPLTATVWSKQSNANAVKPRFMK
jgi:hypothetical protein